jgi:hypothetical protein
VQTPQKVYDATTAKLEGLLAQIESIEAGIRKCKENM